MSVVAPAGTAEPSVPFSRSARIVSMSVSEKSPRHQPPSRYVAGSTPSAVGGNEKDPADRLGSVRTIGVIPRREAA